MKNEIKEILSNDNIHIIECDKNWCNAYGYEKSQLKEDLLDCITNLQEEKEDYKSRCEKANQYIKNNTHEYKMFNEELGHFSNLTNISIDKNNKVFINDLLKILGGDE